MSIDPSRDREGAGNPSVERERHEPLCFCVSAFLRFCVSMFSVRFWGLFATPIIVTMALVFSIAESESPGNFEGGGHEFDSSPSEV